MRRVRFVALSVALLASCIIAADPASKPTTTSGPAKAAFSIDQSTVKALLVTVHQATEAGDAETVLKCTEEASRPFMAALMDAKRVTWHLLAVMDEKLGDAAAKCRKNPFFDTNAARLDEFLDLAMKHGVVDWDKVRIEIDKSGDAAKIAVGQAGSMAKKVGGKWFIAFGRNVTVPDLRRDPAKALQRHIATCEKLEAGVKDGSITKGNFDNELEKISKAVAAPGDEPTSKPADS